jgi:hypothetical protein
MAVMIGSTPVSCVAPISDIPYKNVDPAQLSKFMQDRNFISEQSPLALFQIENRVGTQSWSNTAKAVYQSIQNGNTTPTAIGSDTGLDDDQISAGLSTLASAGYINVNVAVA